MTATSTANDLFLREALSDTPEFPDRAMFLAEDAPGLDLDRALREALHDERRPVVLVSENDLMLIEPYRRLVPLRWLDDMSGRVQVRVSWRRHRYAVRTTVGRHPLADLQREPIEA